MDQLENIMQQVRTLPPQDLARLIQQAAELLEQKWAAAERPAVDYVAFIGAGKGVFESAEEADRFIRAERDVWEK